MQRKIEKYSNDINEFKKEEAEQQSKFSKVEEEIAAHKKNKEFLDQIAIASKMKKPVNQKLRNARKADRLLKENTEDANLRRL